MYLKIEDRIIIDASSRPLAAGRGCHQQLAAELIKGKTIKEAEMVANKVVMEALTVCHPRRCIARFSLRRLLRQPSRITVRGTGLTATANTQAAPGAVADAAAWNSRTETAGNKPVIRV